MSKITVVLRHELITTITRRSFLFGVIGIPLIAFLIFMGVGALNASSSDVLSGLVGSPEKPGGEAEGFVDLAGLVEVIPEDLEPGRLVRYENEPLALAALEAEAISAYYVVPEEYVETGELIYVDPEANPMSGSGLDWVMRWTLLVNMMGGDIEQAGRVWNPMYLQVTTLGSQPQRDSDSPLAFAVPYATTMILYILLLMGSSLLLNSMVNEKKNRVMEILMLSISPRQMLTGKIVGLGIAGLTQAVIWAGTGFLLLRVGGQTLNLPPGFELPASILAWGLVFFLLGYAVYASLLAGLGALAKDSKEASQKTILVIWPVIVPMFFMSVIIENPHGMLATVLSLVPLTAPITMMTRLAAGGVPLWQPLLAGGLLLVTAYVVIRAVSGMFRAQTLLSGQPFSAKKFIRALVGKA